MLYIYINQETIASSYDVLIKKAFNATLHGLLPKNSKYHNGIKFLETKGVCTIKIVSSDYRICTHKIFENPNEEQLLIFDDVMNHKDINKLPKKDIEIIKTEDYSPPLPLPSNLEEWIHEYQQSIKLTGEG